MSTKREAAHDAARRGFDVFPITPNAKMPPLISNWQNLATQDAKQIDAWWDQWPDANIATTTNNMVVPDIDPRNGGKDTFEALAAIEEWPKTAVSNTAGGGNHIFYAAPEGRPVQGGTHKLGQGVDIKARGGYVVLPGSTIDGRAYTWENQNPIALAPQWIVDQCKATNARGEAAGRRIVDEDEIAVQLATDWMLNHAPSAVYGEIDDTTFKVAARLYDYGVSISTATDIMLEWNDIKCSPPGDFDRLIQVTDSASRNRENAIGSKHPSAPGFEAVEIDESKSPSVIPTPSGELIKSSGQFVQDFVPPEYLVDGVLQRRFCYSITAQTGVGKTAIAMLLASHVESGRPLGKLEVAKGTVLYFAGENPTDIQMRWLGLTQEMRIDPNTADVHFIPGAMPLSAVAPRIIAEVAAKGMRPALVVVDTSAAYFEGEDENSNTQAAEHARRLRSLTNLPGGPCVLILCHPTKRANADDMIPRGGGAFLAEVDGNIALHKTDNAIVASAQGKFRGPDFPPLNFGLKTVNHPVLRDARDRPIPTVVARHINETEKQRLAVVNLSLENQVLTAVSVNPDASLRRLAELLGWRFKNGDPAHTKVGRLVDALVSAKLLREQGRGWAPTPAGVAEIKRLETPEIVCTTAGTEDHGFDAETVD